MKHKKLLWVVVILLLAGGAALFAYLRSVGAYKQAVRELSVAPVSLSEVADGTYTGECDVKFIRAKVSVTVEDGAITAIDILEHKNGRGAAAETVIDTILEEQTVEVDAVTGATNSSIVLEKAVEDALEKGLS